MKTIYIPDIPKHAIFITVTGRPNAGKTTLINEIAHTKLATGKRAGTTKKLKIVNLSNNFYIIDFPGYGKVLSRSKKFIDDLKDQMVLFLEEYHDQLVLPIHVIAADTFMINVENLSKKGIIPIDLEFVGFLNEICEKKPLVVLNKIDKLKKKDQDLNVILDIFRNFSVIQASLSNKKGVDRIRGYIRNILNTKSLRKYQKYI